MPATQFERTTRMVSSFGQYEIAMKNYYAAMQGLNDHYASGGTNVNEPFLLQVLRENRDIVNGWHHHYDTIQQDIQDGNDNELPPEDVLPLP